MSLLSLISSVLESVVLVQAVTVALTLAGEDQADTTVPFVDHRLSPGSTILLAVGLSLVVVVLHLVTARINAGVTAGVSRAGRGALLRAYARAGWTTQSMRRQGSFVEAVTTQIAQAAMATGAAANVLTYGGGLVAIITTAVIVDPTATALLVVGGGLFGLLLRPMGAIVRARARARTDANQRFTEEVSDWVGMAMEQRAFGVAESRLADIERSNGKATAALRRVRFATMSNSMVYRDALILLMVAALGLLIAFGVDEVASLGTVSLLAVRSMS